MGLLLILLHAVYALDVQACFYQNRKGEKQEEHLEGWEVGHLHASEIVAYHVARTQQKVADTAEHTAIAYTPDIQKQQEGFLEGIAAYPGRLSATGAVVALEMRAAGSALMLFL